MSGLPVRSRVGVRCVLVAGLVLAALSILGARELRADTIVMDEGRPEAPFGLFVGDAGNWQRPVAVDAVESVDAGVSVSLQDDFIVARWQGDALAQLYLSATEPLDFSSMDSPALHFRFRLDEPATGDTLIRLGCGYPCGGDVRLDNVLAEAEPGRWTNTTIPLSCFVDAGADISRIDVPWQLSTEGRLALAIESIRMVSDADNGECPRAPSVVDALQPGDMLEVMSGDAIAPFTLMVGDKGDWALLVSDSDFESRLGAVAVEAEEADGRRLTWTGTSEAQVYLQSAEPLDITSLVAQDSALVLLMRVNRAPSKSVQLRMACGYPCQAEADVTRLMEAIPPATWGTVSFDLRCFTEEGLRADRVDSPLVIATRGAFSMSLRQVAIVPGIGPRATVKCDN